MSQARERLAQRGIEVGNVEEPLAPVVEQFKEKGVRIASSTASRFRTRLTSGESTVERLDLMGVLVTGRTEQKYGCYGEIIGALRQLRQPQMGLAHRWTSGGYTDKVAGRLGVDDQSLRQAIRAMRLDMVLGARFNPELRDGLMPVFAAVVDGYLKAYTSLELNPPSRVEERKVKLGQRWDGTMKGWYRLMELMGGERLRGTFLAYEVEVLAAFNEFQSERGMRMSALDWLSCRWYGRRRYGIDRLVGKLRRITGVPADRHTIYAHRKMILYGREGLKGDS